MKRFCCNPFKKRNHKTFKIYQQLRNITPAFAASTQITRYRLVPESKICVTCRVQVINCIKQKRKELHQQQQASSDDVAMEIEPEERNPLFPSPLQTDLIDKQEFIRVLNTILPQIEIEKIDFAKIDRSHSYCRNVLKDISEKMASKIFEIPRIDIAPAEQNEDQEIVKQLKDKFAETTDKDLKIKILSVLPRSWSSRKMEKEFNTTYHLARLTKKLVGENGIMCGPKKRIGTHTLDIDTVSLVKQFYSSDDISRVCPGKRDFVTVNENNEKISKQRRLILMNLKEAYALFKQAHIGLKIGFSKFASLRPGECVLALSNVGTHSVCVCVYHQNVKLIFESMKKVFGIDSYRDLFRKMMCDEPKDNCNLGKCTQCPGVEEMERHLGEILVANEINEVPYKQWINQYGKNQWDLIEINNIK